MTTLRAAVVGLGGMGRRHLQALSALDVDTVAVCDQSQAALDAVIGTPGQTAATYRDWRDLLEAEGDRLDLLTVATNGPSHHAIVLAAASRGIRHVLCEKPMAISGAQARAMAEACRRSDTRLAVNMSRRFADRFVRLRSMLVAGEIGRLLHFNVSVGAGGLGCIGTHYFDFVAWLAGTRASWIIGQVDDNPAPNVRGPQFFDPGGRGLVGYENGMTACYQLLGDSPITPLMQISGSEGFVEFDGWTPPSGRIAIYARPPEMRTTLKTRFVQPQPVKFELSEPLDVVAATRACLEDLLSEHREDTVSAGIAAVDTVIGFHLSSKGGWTKIDLPLTGNDLAFEVAVT